MFMILKTRIKTEQLFCLKETMKKEHIFSILSNFYGHVCVLICFSFVWASLIAQLVKNPPAKKKKKESTCNAGDPGLIPGSGKSAREGIGYPLQYSWASLVAQLVKNLPAMRETWVQSLGWEDPLEKGKATHSSILAGRNPWTI